MGYPLDLDEIPTVKLVAELARRNRAVANGLCAYCNQPIDTHTCRYEGKEADYHDSDQTRTAQAGRKE